jgi:hypothetical protein
MRLLQHRRVHYVINHPPSWDSSNPTEIVEAAERFYTGRLHGYRRTPGRADSDGLALFIFHRVHRGGIMYLT